MTDDESGSCVGLRSIYNEDKGTHLVVVTGGRKLGGGLEGGGGGSAVNNLLVNAQVALMSSVHLHLHVKIAARLLLQCTNIHGCGAMHALADMALRTALCAGGIDAAALRAL